MSKKYYFDPERFRDLKEGSITPVNKSEEYFVLAYRWALGDQTLLDLMIQLGNDTETMTNTDWACLCSGYGLAEAEVRYLDVLELTPNKSKISH